MNVERLTRKDRAATVAALAAAFADYPVMRYTLSDAGAAYDERLRELIGFFCDKRFVRGWPVLGVRVAGEVAAAALAHEPQAAPAPLAPPQVEQLRAAMVARIGAAAWERFMRYEHNSDLDAPAGPHHFLGVIGVRPENQGQGLARLLLDELAEMAARHPTSTGICLNTELPANVPFYEHMGYRVIAHRKIEPLETWCMFRPDA